MSGLPAWSLFSEWVQRVVVWNLSDELSTRCAKCRRFTRGHYVGTSTPTTWEIVDVAEILPRVEVQREDAKPKAVVSLVPDAFVLEFVIVGSNYIQVASIAVEFNLNPA